MVREEFFYPDASNAGQIYAQIWLPEGHPRAILQIVHGINDYGGRYEDMARYFTERGFVVAAEDHMGHGHTVPPGRERGSLAERDGWGNMLRDILGLTLRLEGRWPHLPIFLMGHSMGSFAVRCIVMGYERPWAGVILSGTGCNPPAIYKLGDAVCAWAALFRGRHGRSPLVRALAFGGYAAKFPGEGTMAWLSRDLSVGQSFLADPMQNFKPDIQLYREMFRGMSYMDDPDNYAHINIATPILLVSGDQDPVGHMGKDPELVYRRLLAAGCDAELILYPGGRHEMFMETNKEQFFADVAQWVEGKMQ